MQGDRSSRDVLFTLTLLDALLWRHRPPPLLCACSVHIGRLHRSRRPAGRSYKSRRALCAHGARCPASKGVRPPSPRCSRRPHRTMTILLSPSCRAIIQVETRSLCAHGARCLSLASGRRRRRCALAKLPSTWDVYTALAIVQSDRSSRDALVVRSRCARCPSLASGRRPPSLLCA